MAETPNQARARYRAMRTAALADAEGRLRARIFVRSGVSIGLSLIDEAALQAWEGQWKPRSDRPGGWNWRDERLALQSIFNRFEVALWSGDILSGLAIGKPSKGPSHLAVSLLEGNPAEGHPLKGFVAECVVEAGISYARLLGKKALRFNEPLPGALPTYRKLGFKVELESDKPPYCILEV